MNKQNALLDSDVLVAWFIEHDANHNAAVAMLERARQEDVQLAVTNLVIGETATLLSYRIGQDMARLFLRKTADFTLILVTQALHDETIDLFQKQTRKRTSYVDCSNVVVVQYFSVSFLGAFDGFYKDFKLKMLA